MLSLLAGWRATRVPAQMIELKRKSRSGSSCFYEIFVQLRVELLFGGLTKRQAAVHPADLPSWVALFLLVTFDPVQHAYSMKVSLVGRITDRFKAVILKAKVAAVSARSVKTIWRRASGLHGRRTASLAKSKFLCPSS